MTTDTKSTTESTNQEWLDDETKAGNYFVSNYPPYSFWNAEHVRDVYAAIERPPVPGTPLGIYVHIPFCRKRCHFCYFKVYTDKNAGEVEAYLNTVIQELSLYASKPVIGGRKPSFIYFGGGTPSYISTTQLKQLTDGMKNLLPWDEIKEVAFECEPGTLTEGKVRVLKEVGITRLSLGIENFNEEILKTNGRAHGAKEIDRAYGFIRAAGFQQVNIDLISGMIGETEDNWRECVRRTIEMDADSVTIYQMEVPYNTTIVHDMKVWDGRPCRQLEDQARMGEVRLR
jgi:oxygen-independent coproporphyrinogen-3 oxidase